MSITFETIFKPAVVAMATEKINTGETHLNAVGFRSHDFFYVFHKAFVKRFYRRLHSLPLK
jgi:hypothetical protein